MKKYERSLFIFRRDLRLIDNTGLNAALAQSREVLPCFIFDPIQVGHANPYRSQNAIQFMRNSLEELDQDLHKKKSRLWVFYGTPAEVIEQCFSKQTINALFVNRDYTPYSMVRDRALKEACKRYNVDFISCNDLLLHEPEEVLKKNNQPYTIFTPFYKRAHTSAPRKPEHTRHHTFYAHTTPKQKNSPQERRFKDIDLAYNSHAFLQGGRKEGLKLLAQTKHLTDYAKTRDFPSEKTSSLSAHLKFGTLSIREAYYKIKEELGSQHPLLRQLYWRDFFTHLAYHYPSVFGHSFHKKYDALPWHHNHELFDAWKKGLTGFPIVDAGMRQLTTTGWMHNRVRMIAASFLVKDLHIDWRKGEQYFAQHLIDYDPSVNNGNWQWSASTGADAQPYFRIFNPWLQQKKFDPQCIYIKKWVPELRALEPKEIHQWATNTVTVKGYPKPIVSHEKESKKAKFAYKNI